MTTSVFVLIVLSERCLTGCGKVGSRRCVEPETWAARQPWNLEVIHFVQFITIINL